MLEEMIREYKQVVTKLRWAIERYHNCKDMIQGRVVTSEHYRQRGRGLSPQVDMVLKEEEAFEIAKTLKKKQEEQKKKLEEIIWKIPDKKLQKIIWERCYHNRKWEEIGLMVGISAKAAQLRYKRFFEKEAA